MLDFTKYESKVVCRETREEYNIERERLLNKFENDLYEDLDIKDNPKRKLLFNKALGLAHSNGYHEVYFYATELVNLIR